MAEEIYKHEDIVTAHNKQKLRNRGVGGVIFTAKEREIIDNHIPLPEKK